MMQLPGSSFVHPDSPLRDALTAAAARQVTRMTGNGNEWIAKSCPARGIMSKVLEMLTT